MQKKGDEMMENVEKWIEFNMLTERETETDKVSEWQLLVFENKSQTFEKL